MTPRHLIVPTLALLLVAGGAAPALAGGPWLAGDGVPEPNTAYDSGTFMPQHVNDRAHPGGVAERIYFNGFLVDAGRGSVNPAGGSVTPTEVRFAAFLGYWRDCNGDGYVGAKSVPAAPGGMYGHWSNGAYPADAMSVDAALCPPGSAYNQGLFIDEFRWIGPNATPTQEELNRGDRFACDPQDYITIIEDCTRTWDDVDDVTDQDVRMWGDWGRPDAVVERPRPPVPDSAYANSSSTLDVLGGALIEAQLESERSLGVGGVHVFDGRLAEEGTWDGKPNLGACGGERTFAGGPGFAGTGQGTCGLYPLWQAKRLYSDADETEDGDATPIATVFDADEDADGSGSPCDDVGAQGVASTADPEPGVHEDPLMHGSIGGTLYRNVFPVTGHGLIAVANGQCSPKSNPPDPFGTRIGGIPPGKDGVDSVLRFSPDSRLRTLRGYGIDHVPMHHLGFGQGARWSSWVTVFATPPALDAPVFTTLHADVGNAAFTNAGSGASPGAALPAGVQDAHTYGALQCGGDYSDTAENRAGNAFGWVCSREAWSSTTYYPGRAFDFRDVDCYDQSPSHTNAATESPEVVVNAGGSEETAITLRTTCASWHTV